jgi:tetratricopeptide (TPR) repeat protein
VLEEMPDWVPLIEYWWLRQELLGGEYHAALERLARSHEPITWWWQNSAFECLCHYCLREPEKAAERCEAVLVSQLQAVAERPSAPGPHILLAWAYVGLGRREEAIREAREVDALATTTGVTRDRTVVLEQLAAIYAAVGEPDEALDRIDGLLSIPGSLSVARLRLEPHWDPLRDHPRFAEILDKYAEEE